MTSKKVLIVSSGQPSLNPRMVKEADALTQAGYDVVVLYAYWNDWGTELDTKLLPQKPWKAKCIGGAPLRNRKDWYLSRLIHKSAVYFLKKTGNHNLWGDIAISRSSYFLIKAAKKHKADFYIAHNLGALPAVAKAAAFHGKPCGFDAEDFHRQELSDETNSYHFKICSKLEDKYLPAIDYLTAASPLIADQYSILYKREVTCILNVFPKTAVKTIAQDNNKPLKLFWFSQTVGPKRGLETIIDAIALYGPGTELHLLGNIRDGYREKLLELANNKNVDHRNIFFYAPVTGEVIFDMAAQFDIGLASETGFCLNNNIALSNKIFTYIQSGIATAASNTLAQSAFIKQYPQTGKIYGDASQLASILTFYSQNRGLLQKTRQDAFDIGQTELNWENESKKFLNVVENSLTGWPRNGK